MLKQGNCVALFTGKASGELESRAGESLLVRRIEAYQTEDEDYLTLKTDRVTTGIYRIAGKANGHIETIRVGSLRFNLMEFLEKRGHNVALPVAEGQVFSWVATAAVDAVMIVFDRYDAGDILKTAPNGSESKEYTFMQYMNVGISPTKAGDSLFDTSLSPAEFPDFPCGKVVPARHKITMLGLIGCPWRDGQADEKGFSTSYIKMVKDREVLFDIDRKGIPFKGSAGEGTTLIYNSLFSLIGAGVYSLGTTDGGQGDPLMFDPPLEFVAGEELNVYVSHTTYGDTPIWTATAPDLAAILKVVKE